jgi:hypothetical protein
MNLYGKQNVNTKNVIPLPLLKHLHIKIDLCMVGVGVKRK